MPSWCPYCNRRFKTNRGLHKHIGIVTACREAEKVALRGLEPTPSRPAANYLPVERIEAVPKRARYELTSTVLAVGHHGPNCAQSLPTDPIHNDSDEEGDFVQGWNDDVDDADDVDDEDTSGPLTIIQHNFENYVKNAATQFGTFRPWWQSTLKLLYMLRKSNASLNLYEKVMEWHVRELSTSQVFHDSIIGRQKVFDTLFERYNMANNINIVREITLPSSRARAKIFTNSFGWCLQSLLTDPRIVGDDYLFHNDDPLAAPPNNFDFIGDINTSKAYTESYKKYITNPSKQVLLPVIFYIDGAATGQFADLPVTPLRFTLGIFCRKARDQPHFWRTVGYVPVVKGEKSRGFRTFHESGHVDSLMREIADEEGLVGGSNVEKAQDLHTILSELLEEYVIIQERGFKWDLQYKGKLYKDIEFVLYVHFIKCDTEEADRMAGKYTSRTINVGTLCRYCCCPTAESDDPLADYPRKTVTMIKTLIDNGDEDKLKAMSQQVIQNAWYPIRFGAHNDEGVHCAAPLEMLHALLLGIFKYVRDCFFEQVGEKSQQATEVNALATVYSELYARQSDRDMPKTQFSNGIQQGKLMAKEYPGVLLLIATILRSSAGSKLLCSKQNSTFANDGVVAEWIELVETLLMWEVWLNSDKMSKRHVKRAERKHRFIMYLLRRTANRQAGMGLKLTKFHAIVHMATDILHFGVPLCFDTGSDEAGHKPMKKAAKVTQKQKEVFDKQVGQRMAEVHALDLAHQEMENGRLLWCYTNGYPDIGSRSGTKKAPNNCPHGTVFGFVRDAAGAQRRYTVLETNVRGIGNFQFPLSFVDFVWELQQKVATFLPGGVRVHSTIVRDGHIYRGTPLFQGGPWYDWVMVDWGGDEGVLPGKIWGFVDLLTAPPQNDIVYGGINIVPGVYAIVESAVFCNTRGEVNSELFRPITTEVGAIRDKRVSRLKFYLADLEAFREPVVVVPDIEGAANRYLLLKNRRQWVEDFQKWLDRKYEDIPDEYPE